MRRRRSFLSAEDVEGVRRLRVYGELCLWRARVASGERRLALLEGAWAAYSSAASLVRRARLKAVGESVEAVEVRSLLRMQRAGFRLERSRAPAGGPDA